MTDGDYRPPHDEEWEGVIWTATHLLDVRARVLLVDDQYRVIAVLYGELGDPVLAALAQTLNRQALPHALIFIPHREASQLIRVYLVASRRCYTFRLPRNTGEWGTRAWLKPSKAIADSFRRLL